MNSNDILGHPGRWKPISRQQALRECGSKTVMVITSGHGPSAVSQFNRFSRFFQSEGPHAPSALRYFLQIGPAQTRWPGTGGVRSAPSQPADPAPGPEPAAVEPAKPVPGIKITGLDCECFAPLVDTVLIHYEIAGDLDQAQAVHLRIASQKKADKPLLERKLVGKPQAKGIFMWDGSVTDGDYQGCVNLVGSPYWVQLGLACGGGPPQFTNKAAIKLELLRTELMVGDASGLGENEKNTKALAVLKEDLRKTPGKGFIHLPGSFFTLNSGEMDTSASYTVYFDFLNKGVPIPLFVKLSLRGKDGGSRRSHRAVAGTRILWDVLPEDEAGLDENLSDRGVHETANQFIKRVSAYKKAGTEPPGATCHWELGGIRANARARKRDREQFAPLLGDWKTAAPRKRGWAGLSVCAKAGEASADSGMLYHNGRIAGDRYRITAYVDLDGSLDDEDPKLDEMVPAPRKSATLALQNWRDVHLSKSYKIGHGTTALAFDDANKEFNKAALSIIPKPGMMPEEIQARWKAEYRNVLAVLSGMQFYRDAAEQDPGPYPAAFISFADYRYKTHPDGDFSGKVWNRIKDFFGAPDDDAYIQKCNHAAYQIYTEVAKAFPLGEDGMTVFKFGQNGDHNRHSGACLAGIALAIPGYTTRTKSVFFIFSPGQAADTVMHEMGHNLFLPHAPGHWKTGKHPGGCDPAKHDKNQICLMSYHPERKYFCALCLLRMGGWDHDAIRNDATVLDRVKSP